MLAVPDALSLRRMNLERRYGSNMVGSQVARVPRRAGDSIRFPDPSGQHRRSGAGRVLHAAEKLDTAGFLRDWHEKSTCDKSVKVLRCFVLAL